MTRNAYSVSSRLLNFLVKVVSSVPRDVFSFDYNLSDYWTKRARHIDHSRIRAVFEEENFTSFKREDYYSHRTRIFNPISIIHRRICEPDMSLWIAKK